MRAFRLHAGAGSTWHALAACAVHVARQCDSDPTTRFPCSGLDQTSPTILLLIERLASNHAFQSKPQSMTIAYGDGIRFVHISQFRLLSSRLRMLERMFANKLAFLLREVQITWSILCILGLLGASSTALSRPDSGLSSKSLQQDAPPGLAAAAAITRCCSACLGCACSNQHTPASPW